jgi:RHS repeat-associated protein
VQPIKKRKARIFKTKRLIGIELNNMDESQMTITRQRAFATRASGVMQPNMIEKVSISDKNKNWFLTLVLTSLSVDLYYPYKDYLGSLLCLTDESGNEVQRYSFDAWGHRRNPTNWNQWQEDSTDYITNRGFTGHVCDAHILQGEAAGKYVADTIPPAERGGKHMDLFGLIIMSNEVRSRTLFMSGNGRVYDPNLGRFLSPDPYVQMPNNSQNFNRYTYALNNPLVYTDPDGEFFWIPFAIGAVIGGYTGYKIADAKGYNLGDWQTYGYMLGGAAIGGFSGALGAEIAAAGGFMANTSAMVFSSYSYSMGMVALSGGMIQPNVNFGFGSYNFGTGEFNSIFNWNDLSTMEKIGYSIGTFANLSDIYAGIKGAYGNKLGEVDLVTKNDPIGHTALVDKEGKNIVSVGPDIQNYQRGDNFWDAPGTNNWYNHLDDRGFDKLTVTKIKITNVRLDKINEYVQNNLQNFRYRALITNCVTEASRALLKAGVLNIPVFRHPALLQMQMFIRQNSFYTTYLYNY